MKGVIARVILGKGYGFIRGDDRVNYFFHAKSVEDFDLLREGVGVEFVPVEHDRGQRAEEIKVYVPDGD